MLLEIGMVSFLGGITATDFVLHDTNSSELDKQTSIIFFESNFINVIFFVIDLP